MALKTALKTHIINKLIDDFAVDSNSSNFLFIARPEGWSDDASPPTYVDNTESYNDVYKRMIAAKRVTSVDAYLMAPKNSWSSGSNYSMYTDDDDMSGITFYTTNSDNNVYKCIFNGLSGGNTTSTKPSTASPRGTSINTITLSDGYVWKFMFKVPENWGRFITDDHIPVKKLDLESGVSEKFDDERQLQYSVQYNAVNGSIDYIDITGSGSSYGNRVFSDDTILPSNKRTYIVAAANTGTTGYADLNETESSYSDDFYNTYVINIVKGAGVGQSKRISEYSGGIKRAVIDSNWTTIPDTTSLYEIMPEITIDGDGVSATALAVMHQEGGITLGSARVTNSGNGYTRAYVTVKTANNGDTATFEPMISPYGGHGSDPISEIPPTRLMLLARLDREDGGITGNNIYTGSFPLVNDFRQYGILRNPILATGPRKGKIAGLEVDTVTNINISAATGSVYNAGDFATGDIVLGETSTSCGEVLDWYRSTDISKGTLRLLNTNKFIIGESVIGLGTGSNWSSSGKGVGYVQFQGETTITQTNSHYRMTTALEIRSTAGSSGTTYSSSHANYDRDRTISGASGSSATIVEYIPSGGQTATLYLSTIVGSSGADQHGFTVGENLAGVTVESVINKIYVPEFVKGSGEVLYINNVTPITRHNEQEEEIKIIIDI